MNVQDIIDVLGTCRGGTIVTGHFDRPAKVKKKYEGPEIRKQSVLQFLVKAEYCNTKAVKEAIAEGTRNEPETPAWVEEVLVNSGVKFWRKGEQWYLVVVPVKPLPGTWTLDGKVVPKDEIREFLLADDAKDTDYSTEKEARADQGQSMFNAVKVENVVHFS